MNAGRPPKSRIAALVNMPSNEQFQAWADEYRIPFDTLVGRYVRGLRGDQLFESNWIHKGDDWLETHEVRERLNLSAPRLVAINAKYPNWCRRVPWNRRRRNGQQCGWLYAKRDIERVCAVRDSLKLRQIEVIRLFYVTRQQGLVIKLDKAPA